MIQTSSPGLAMQAPGCARSARSLLAPDSSTGTNRIRIGVKSLPWTKRVTVEALLAELDEAVSSASANQIDILLLPELLTLKTIANSNSALERNFVRDVISPQLIAWAQDRSQRHRLTIVAGSTPILESGNTFNMVILAFPDGRVIKQAKLVLTPEEVTWGWSAGNEINHVITDAGTWVPLICYDCEIPTLSARLVAERPSLILVPSMTGELGLGRVLGTARGRAIEHQAFVAVAGVGVGPSGDLAAKSSVFGPSNGPFLDQIGSLAKNSSDLLVVDLSTNQLEALRMDPNLINPARDDRFAALIGSAGLTVNRIDIRSLPLKPATD